MTDETSPDFIIDPPPNSHGNPPPSSYPNGGGSLDQAGFAQDRGQLSSFDQINEEHKKYLNDLEKRTSELGLEKQRSAYKWVKYLSIFMATIVLVFFGITICSDIKIIKTYAKLSNAQITDTKQEDSSTSNQRTTHIKTENKNRKIEETEKSKEEENSNNSFSTQHIPMTAIIIIPAVTSSVVALLILITLVRFVSSFHYSCSPNKKGKDESNEKNISITSLIKEIKDAIS